MFFEFTRNKKTSYEVTKSSYICFDNLKISLEKFVYSVKLCEVKMSVTVF